jgi:hypothetical protein
MMLPSERLSSRISENDKSIRPSLMDVINEYQASGDVIGKFKEALITSDASPEDNNLLILPSDHRLKKVDFDEDLREAFLATIDFLIKNGPSVFGPRVVFIDPSNHPFPIELALRAIMNRPNGGAFITFPTQRVAVRATLGTAKMVRDFHIRTLGFIPVKYGASQQYIDVINSMRTRGFPVLTGIPMSARFAAPNHLWAISNKFPMEYAYSINEITRSLLPGFPPEPPTHLSRAALATMPSEG